jgi:tetratricopeptide (TPR) repeat protein
MRKDAHMVVDGLWALVCASAVMTCGSDGPMPTAPTESRENTVASTLAVQTALQRGREFLLKNDAKSAVAVLESQISYINGSTTYLKILQTAYRAYVQELRIKKQDAEAQVYLARLAILDRTATNDPALTGRSADAMMRPGPLPTAPTKPGTTIRLKGDEVVVPSKLTAGVASGRESASAILAKADMEFERKHYDQARVLYEQADSLDPHVPQPSRERWAYCRLYDVVARLNNPQVKAELNGLEKEAQVALELAPRLEFAKKVLAEIQARRNGSNSVAERAPSHVALRHHERNAEGWLWCESGAFVIYHKTTAEVAEQAVQAAEAARANVQQKWFGGASRSWTPRCEVYLHPTAEDYGRATGHYNSPGHSSIRVENGHFLVRRIDLHCDDANMLPAILPHETMHIVLASEIVADLGDQQLERLPRWADEGLAVLNEPKGKVERHLSNLAKARQDRILFSLRELMELPNYPQNPRQISTFYAQSVSLVEFLSSLRGPEAFMHFLQDSLRSGYEPALQRHFNIASFNDLEERWTIYMVGDQALSARVAGAGR